MGNRPEDHSLDINSPKDKSWTSTDMILEFLLGNSPEDQSLDINSAEDKSWTLIALDTRVFSKEIRHGYQSFDINSLKIYLGY